MADKFVMKYTKAKESLEGLDGCGWLPCEDCGGLDWVGSYTIGIYIIPKVFDFGSEKLALLDGNPEVILA